MCAVRTLAAKFASGIGRNAPPRGYRLSLIVALVLTTLPGMAVAQHVTTGSISGQVNDGASNPLVDATVTATSSQGTKSTQTDTKGRFLIPYLTPSTYDIKVVLDEYQSVEQSNVNVSLGQRIKLHFTLPSGTFEESIEVVGTSPVVFLPAPDRSGVRSL